MALRKTEFRCRLTVDWIHWIILQVINTFGRFLLYKYYTMPFVLQENGELVLILLQRISS